MIVFTINEKKALKQAVSHIVNTASLYNTERANFRVVRHKLELWIKEDETGEQSKNTPA